MCKHSLQQPASVPVCETVPLPLQGSVQGAVLPVTMCTRASAWKNAVTTSRWCTEHLSISTSRFSFLTPDWSNISVFLHKYVIRLVFTAKAEPQHYIIESPVPISTTGVPVVTPWILVTIKMLSSQQWQPAWVLLLLEETPICLLRYHTY